MRTFRSVDFLLEFSEISSQAKQGVPFDMVKLNKIQRHWSEGKSLFLIVLPLLFSTKVKKNILHVFEEIEKTDEHTNSKVSYEVVRILAHTHSIIDELVHDQERMSSIQKIEMTILEHFALKSTAKRAAQNKSIKVIKSPYKEPQKKVIRSSSGSKMLTLVTKRLKNRQ